MKSQLMLLTSAVAAAGLLTLATTASADPGSFRTYPGVGSDTTQDVWNTLDDTIPNTTGPKLGSYDAFGTATIQTRTGGATFTRPAGSGEGVKALSASVDPADHLYKGVNIAGQVDWARSSSGPATTGTALTYLPFARDAVSVAYNVPSVDATAGQIDLSTADLTAIYNCTKTSIVVNGKTLPVRPKLPQTGSGTRSFFLKAIGVTTVGGCVTDVGAENDGSQIPADGDLIPFSAAQWNAQKSGAVTNTIAATDLKIAKINGKVPDPAAGASSLYGALNTAPATTVGTFARDTYNVIPAAKKGTELETFLNQGANSTATLNKFGFGQLTYVGDATNYKGSAYSH